MHLLTKRVRLNMPSFISRASRLHDARFIFMDARISARSLRVAAPASPVIAGTKVEPTTIAKPKAAAVAAKLKRVIAVSSIARIGERAPTLQSVREPVVNRCATCTFRVHRTGNAIDRIPAARAHMADNTIKTADYLNFRIHSSLLPDR
jgi:hypothetical protein